MTTPLSIKSIKFIQGGGGGREDHKNQLICKMVNTQLDHHPSWPCCDIFIIIDHFSFST